MCVMKVADGVRGDKGRITDFLNNHTRLWIHTNTVIYTRQHKQILWKNTNIRTVMGNTNTAFVKFNTIYIHMQE